MDAWSIGRCRYILRFSCTRMQRICAEARSTQFGIGIYIHRHLLVTIQHPWRRKTTTRNSTCPLWAPTILTAPLRTYLTSLVEREGMGVIPQDRAGARYPYRETGRFSSREAGDNTTFIWSRVFEQAFSNLMLLKQMAKYS